MATGMTDDVSLATSSVDFPTIQSGPQGIPIPKIGTLIPNRIFVGGIHSNTTEEELRNFFSVFGAIRDVKVIYDKSGLSKGSYGFVTFEDQTTADNIIKNEAETLVFKDRKLNIGYAVRKQHVLPKPEVNGTFVLAHNTCTLGNGLSYIQLCPHEHQIIAINPSGFCYPTALMIAPNTIAKRNLFTNTGTPSEGDLTLPVSHNTHTITNLNTFMRENMNQSIPQLDTSRGATVLVQGLNSVSSTNGGLSSSPVCLSDGTVRDPSIWNSQPDTISRFDMNRSYTTNGSRSNNSTRPTEASSLRNDQHNFPVSNSMSPWRGRQLIDRFPSQTQSVQDHRSVRPQPLFSSMGTTVNQMIPGMRSTVATSTNAPGNNRSRVDDFVDEAARVGMSDSHMRTVPSTFDSSTLFGYGTKVTDQNQFFIRPKMQVPSTTDGFKWIHSFSSNDGLASQDASMDANFTFDQSTEPADIFQRTSLRTNTTDNPNRGSGVSWAMPGSNQSIRTGLTQSDLSQNSGGAMYTGVNRSIPPPIGSKERSTRPCDEQELNGLTLPYGSRYFFRSDNTKENHLTPSSRGPSVEGKRVENGYPPNILCDGLLTRSRTENGNYKDTSLTQHTAPTNDSSPQRTTMLLYDDIPATRLNCETPQAMRFAIRELLSDTPAGPSFTYLQQMNQPHEFHDSRVINRQSSSKESQTLFSTPINIDTKSNCMLVNSIESLDLSANTTSAYGDISKQLRPIG